MKAIPSKGMTIQDTAIYMLCESEKLGDAVYCVFNGVRLFAGPGFTEEDIVYQFSQVKEAVFNQY